MTTKHYKVKTSPLFEKEFAKLDSSVQKMISKFVKINLVDCTNPGLKGKSLVCNLKGLWRYRIGDYRLICEIRDNELIIIALNIGHRKNIYKSKAPK